MDGACYSVWPHWPTKWKNNRTEGSFMYFIKPSGEWFFKNLSGPLMDNRELSWTPYSLIILILECIKTVFENAHVLKENCRLFLWIVLYEYVDRCTCSLFFLGLLFCLTAERSWFCLPSWRPCRQCSIWDRSLLKRTAVSCNIFWGTGVLFHCYF